MKTLKLTDDQQNSLELTYDTIEREELDVPSALIAVKWESQEAFFNIEEVSDMSEFIKWLEFIKEKMVDFKKSQTKIQQT